MNEAVVIGGPYSGKVVRFEPGRGVVFLEPQPPAITSEVLFGEPARTRHLYPERVSVMTNVILWDVRPDEVDAALRDLLTSFMKQLAARVAKEPEG